MPLETESKLLLVDDLPENLLALEALIRGEDRAILQQLMENLRSVHLVQILNLHLF